MNTMSEKVKKIMAAVIECSLHREMAMEVLRVKYDWLYPYITNEVWDDHYGLYLKSKDALLETKCGCVIRRDSKEHDECRCDNDGENWICAGCYSGEYDEEESKSKIVITPENIYNYFVIEEWDEENKSDGTDGFSYFQKYDIIGGNDEDEGFDELHNKMFNEFSLSYDNFNEKRSCMWVEEVKRRAKWVRGETLYGYSREKHYTFPIWWSRDKKNIGYATWILEADGYVSFSFANGYTGDETEHTKYRNYIRPSCLYNDKNCDELTAIKKTKK